VYGDRIEPNAAHCRGWSGNRGPRSRKIPSGMSRVRRRDAEGARSMERSSAFPTTRRWVSPLIIISRTAHHQLDLRPQVCRSFGKALPCVTALLQLKFSHMNYEFLVLVPTRTRTVRAVYQVRKPPFLEPTFSAW